MSQTGSNAMVMLTRLCHFPILCHFFGFVVHT